MTNATPGTTHDEKDTPDTSKNPAPTLNKWSVATITVALLILAVFSAWVVDHYQVDSATNAATILGIVVPAFTTIGAAAFGVTVAYKTGKQQGKVTGHQSGKAEAAKKLAPFVADARKNLAAHTQQIQEQSASVPGTTHWTFDRNYVRDAMTYIDLKEDPGFAAKSPPAPPETTLDPSALNDASTNLAQLDAVISSMAS